MYDGASAVLVSGPLTWNAMAASVFFSYSHDDETYRDQLEKHMALLKRQGFIEAWHDRRINVGEHIDESINQALERADVILILVSSSFLASDYCYSREMLRAIERHKEKVASVVPVIVRPHRLAISSRHLRMGRRSRGGLTPTKHIRMSLKGSERFWKVRWEIGSRR